MGHPRNPETAPGAGSDALGAELIVYGVVAGITFTEKEFAAAAGRRVGGLGSAVIPPVWNRRQRLPDFRFIRLWGHSLAFGSSPLLYFMQGKIDDACRANPD
jgi:hypothetical protein